MNRSFLADLAERMGRAFLSGALAAPLPALTLTDWSTVKVSAVSAASGGIAAVLEMLLGLPARSVGDPATASYTKGTEDAG